MLGVCLKYTQHNYGSKLQALATVKMFEKLGVDYEIIRYNKKTLSFYLKSIPRLFNIVFLNDRYDEIQRKIEFKRHPEVKKMIDIRNAAFDSFDVNFEGHLSEVYPSYENLCEECGKRYDRVITCSDQLWSPSALGSGFYNLMFVPQDTLKISWASSFGVSNIPKSQLKQTKEYLNRIEYISMRENRGAEIVRELTGREVPVLMDPVFVFDKADWEKMVPRSQVYDEPYIFCYFLGDNPEHRKLAVQAAAKLNLKIVTIRHLDRFIAADENFGDFAPYDVGPEKFLNILRHAEYVFTDSFHGTAFSVLEEKEFVVFNRYLDKSSNSKNSRIESVCRNLGLQDRRCTADNLDIAKILSNPIDYGRVKPLVEKYRESTLDYLQIIKSDSN